MAESSSIDSLFSIAVAAVSAFVATNLDDIFLLTIYFTQVPATLEVQNIVVGYYLGFALICILTLPGFFGGHMVPAAWIGLLGLAPLCIGLWKLVAPENGEEGEEASSSPLRGAPAQPMAIRWMDPRTYAIAAITFTNCGNNVVIYVPLFASCSMTALGLTLLVFFIMLGVWCGLGKFLGDHSGLSAICGRYGNRLIPLVLIGLGLFIIIKNESYQLLFWAETISGDLTCSQPDLGNQQEAPLP